MERIAISIQNIPIRLNEERIKHINKNHPELIGNELLILNTVENPDILLEGDSGEILAAKFFSKTPVSKNKFLVVAYKIISQYDGFIITAYFTKKLRSRRKVLWKR